MQSKIPVRRVLPIIRVFVSSTFSDLKHERNALHAKVWPELERYCQQRGFTFQAIDLRWGVPAEAGLDHRTMRICFEELRRSQDTSPEPNFLILLGNRYGWRPLPEAISVEEFEKLKAASKLIQTEPVDPARKMTDKQMALLKKAVAILGDWYLLDENARPFGDETRLGEYVLRSRKTSFDGVDYGRQPDANGILRDTAAWVDVQFVLWSIVNLAFPAADLAGRFQALHETSPGTVPSSVRFQASATEQEIWQGALQVENADRHVIAAVREVVDLDAFPNRPRRSDFIDLKDDGTPDADARQALADLKAELERRLSKSKVLPGESPIIRSTCQWAIDQDNNPTGDVSTSHLDDFCREILDRFKSIIIEQINAYWGCDLSADDASLAQVRGSQQELDLECADHLRFAGERAPKGTFVGREVELQRIRDYLHSETNQPFVVHGPSGSGKTALLGNIIQEVTPPRIADGTRAKTGAIVLTRFIGTTPESSNFRSLLSSLCRELRQDFEMTKTRKTPDGKTEIYSPPLPTDLNELIDEFYSQLGKATAARPVFVFLDALDQLDAADHGRSVFWIRSPLSSTTDAPCHARMVVSCLSPSDEFPEDSDACEPFQDLKLRKLLGKHELGALEEKEARELFELWLHDSERSVSETQQNRIWSAIHKESACRQPLFLKVLYEEARRWRSFDKPPAIPKSLRKLLDGVFVRLGKPNEHGKLVRIALSCLVSARYGLSEGEMLEILYTDKKYKALLNRDNKRNGHKLPPRSSRIPIALWTRLRSDLASYISERSAPGTAVMHFYHRQVEQAVRKRFLRTPDQQTSCYRQLANYFDGRWNRPDPHALMEIPHLRLRCQDHDDLLRLLTDLQFPMRKTHAGYVSDLVRDYNELQAILVGSQRDALAPWYYFVRGNTSFLSDYPECFFQQAYNEPVNSPVSQAAQTSWTNVTEGRSPENARSNDVPTEILEWTNRTEIWEYPLCLATLAGHRDVVRCVAITPDGATVVSGSGANNNVKSWDVATGTCRKSLTGQFKSVESVALTANRDIVATGSDADALKIWNVRTGMYRSLLFGDSGGGKCVAISPDGEIVVSGSYDGTVKIWDARSGICLHTLSGLKKKVVSSVAVTPDGKTVVFGSMDGTVEIWDARSGICRQMPSGHNDWVNSVAVTPDGETAVSGSMDGTVKIWDARSGIRRHTLSWDSNVHSVAVTPDGETVVCGLGERFSSITGPKGIPAREKTGLFNQDYNTVQIWDARSGIRRHTLSGHQDKVFSVAVTPDGATVVSGSADGTLKIWHVRAAEHRQSTLESLLQKVRGGTRNRSVLLTRDRGTVIAGSKGVIEIWDARTGACRLSLCGSNTILSAHSTTPDGATFVAGGEDGIVKIWDTRTGICRQTLSKHSMEVTTAAVSTDGETVVTGSEDCTVKIWDTRSGECRRTLAGHQGIVVDVQLTHDGEAVVSYSHDGTVRIWDARTGTCRQTIALGADCVANLELPPDGTTIVTTFSDGSLKIWDVQTGDCRQSLPVNLQQHVAHTDHVDYLAVTREGGAVVTGSADGTVRIWDARTGERRQLFFQVYFQGGVAGGISRDGFRSLAVTPDGGTIVSGYAHWRDLGSTNSIIIFRIERWDQPAAESQQRIHVGNDNVWCLAVTPDGRTIVSGLSEKWGDPIKFKIWDARTLECRQTLSGNAENVSSVAATPDVETVVSGSHHGIIEIWDARTGECRRTLSGHAKGVYSVAVTPDGKTVVSGSWDNTVRIWNASSGECLAIHPMNSSAARTAWADAGSPNAFDLTPDRGHLVYRLSTGKDEQHPTLAFPGPFEQACGPLVGDTILAFRGNGAADCFRIRRRNQQFASVADLHVHRLESDQPHETDYPFPEKERDFVAQILHQHSNSERLAIPGHDPNDPSLKAWSELSEVWKETSRQHADYFAVCLRKAGLWFRRVVSNAPSITSGSILLEHQVEVLARASHSEWMAEKRRQGWIAASDMRLISRNDALLVHNCLFPWDQLSEELKDLDRYPAREFLKLLMSSGYEIFEP